MPRPVTHFQILAKNPERAAEFYAAVFGWTASDANAMAYRELDTGGVPGGLWPCPPEGHAFVQLFVDVDDVAETARRIAELGGRTIIPPQTLPDGDTMAIVADCEGIPFGLVRRAARS